MMISYCKSFKDDVPDSEVSETQILSPGWKMNPSAFSPSQISQSKVFFWVTVKIFFGWQWFPNKCDYCVIIQGCRPPPFLGCVIKYNPFSWCLRHRASLIVIFLVIMKLYLVVKNNITKVNIEMSQKIAIFCSMLILLLYLTWEHSVAASPHFAFSRNASVCKAFGAIT